MTLAGTAIVSAISILAFPVIAWLIFVRERAIEADERRIQAAERDVEEAATKRFQAKLAGWRDAA